MGKQITGAAKGALVATITTIFPPQMPPTPPPPGVPPPKVGSNGKPAVPPNQPVDPVKPTVTETDVFIDNIIEAGYAVADVFETAGIPYKPCRANDCMNPNYAEGACMICMRYMDNNQMPQV